ncbi:GNAT family N-acetyltransferase [Alcaligenes faecalis]|nr:GNAT family N-acetyltransferase [Providencia rettgeri]MBX7030380.1 GNAT family N-acetyltransferase [Alcaligenes faecalis]
MRLHDLGQVLEVQADVYDADILEGRSFYQNRLDLAPDSCWVARDADNQLQGYLVSYPWAGLLPPSLGDALNSLPSPADQWFIHDCAVMRRAQGQGVAGALLHAGRHYASQRGLRRCSLVSLGPSVGYWLKQGYQPVQGMEPEVLANKLQQYGQQASFMHCLLPSC